MTDKPKPQHDDEFHPTTEFNQGVKALTDMGDYALDDLEKMALGIDAYHPDSIAEPKPDDTEPKPT